MDPLPVMDRSTLRERVLQALRSAVTSGTYRPGDHLGEVELAERLGVSRGTVREALRHLQQEGLVRAGMRGMLRVNSLSAEEIRGLFRVRAALEGLAVTEIIEQPGREQAVAALRAAVETLARAGDDFVTRVEADLGFHLRLCELSGNTMLVESWRHLEGRIRITIMNRGPEGAPAMMTPTRHAPIIDAIERGDLDKALEVVHEHMAAAAEHFTEN
ncbi:DNA-binding transcriptional regulator, GntR family [Amycolatopsis tolypomycina]|uniref:DNA-binding transcriptional regulator, GntR family n=1 Tax=Amycolatopsis tolypomycina TaxID=208445 RepID=A0A1H4XYE7_9PSEU|nr:GntR family transcriptional regulator [Amycolatopsis tolypomycina]SED10170.1 DNA-binding transcriptional regulator, GntR family [Amycolatopsis tolypomycina]